MIARDIKDGMIEAHLFGAAIRRRLRRLFPRQADVDDLVQEVLLRLVRGAHRLSCPDALPWFVAAVTRNVARDELRRRYRQRWLQLTRNGDLPDGAPPEEDLGFAAPEALERCERLLVGLRPEDRAAFLLRVERGCELTEVAALQGVSLATVKRRLARVRARLARFS